ncbi:MAG: substrate-binding domain-containing protein, partial [Alphaproteobacteria bacterium]|nr:substrate-binding domain-containing protein [Alphaproteobacteria bacterium]
MRTTILMATTALLLAAGAPAFAQTAARPDKAPSIVFVPKALGETYAGPDRISLLFDQAHAGAAQAAKELHSPLHYTGPTKIGQRIVPQVDSVTAATARGAGAIVISNNSGDAIGPAIKAAHDKGIKIVSWDSPVPSAADEDVYIAQIDLAQGGKVLAEMAHGILGAAGGKVGVLTVGPDTPGPGTWAKGFQEELRTNPTYATLDVVEVGYGMADEALSYQVAKALIDKHPDLKLIVAADSYSMLAAAKAMRDAKRADVKVTGFGIPSEMRPFVASGQVPKFALWSFKDLGYLAYYTAYLLATDAIKAQPGQQFTAGRLGAYMMMEDPVRHG